MIIVLEGERDALYFSVSEVLSDYVNVVALGKLGIINPPLA